MSSKTKTLRIPVTLRAVLQRLNRALKDEGKEVKAPRGRGPHHGHYVVDTKKGEVVAIDLDEAQLVEMARQRGVLAAWEEVTR
jgi:hypothetical protein